ncbi:MULTISPECIES: hypothetical protein [Mycobacteriaceae]|jgi:hypothetical protein|uniref:Uncharacterized protein n=1 Tax=Mycobacteroides salmoniphilum TaxID=404941 RepID=A0A4R8SF68_9MYCO|nr:MULTISPECIES: hypothetical protein [Mycobacteriaceae]TDZ95477.1 hypothetical protein CCUG60885_01611 [Mycobacteroides salmoniphilum]TEA04573.1 hypothetical protein CCUG60883_01869 [Mycobacteroides salmoniphilum]
MNTPTNYGDTLWRDAHGAFVVLPIAPPSLLTHVAAAKPAAPMVPAGSVSAIKHRAVVAAAANVASVNRGYI